MRVFGDLRRYSPQNGSASSLSKNASLAQITLENRGYFERHKAVQQAASHAQCPIAGNDFAWDRRPQQP